MSPTAVIVVRRESEQDIKIRELYVRVDDGEEHTLLFSQTLELELPPGQHTIKATNRLYTQKQTFTLEPGQQLEFDANNIPGGCFIAFMVLGGTGSYRVSLAKR